MHEYACSYTHKNIVLKQAINNNKKKKKKPSMLLIFNSTLHSKHGKITTKKNQTKENTFLSMYNK